MSVYKQVEYFGLPRLSNFRSVQARRRDRRAHLTDSLKAQRTSVSQSPPARSHPSARKEIGAVPRSDGGYFHPFRCPSKHRNDPKELSRSGPYRSDSRECPEKTANMER